MKSDGIWPAGVAGLVSATALATFFVDDGWLLWIPVGLALIIANHVKSTLGR
jgi:hypothetical protein